MEARISGKTKLMGVFGRPVDHSGSPKMYNFAFARDHMDYAFMAFDVGLEEIEDAIQAIRILDIKGGNFTMPVKNIAAQLVDELSPAAEIVGASNTFINKNGKIIGHNTDGLGFVRNLNANGVDIKGKSFVLIGAGGAGTAIAVQLALDGAGEIHVFNKKDPFFERAVETSRKIMQVAPGVRASVHDLDDLALLKEQLSSADILANTTIIGMAPNTDTPVPLELLHKELIVADTVYKPAETPLIRGAEAVGCRVITGEGMLLQQGMANYELFTGKKFPLKEFLEFNR